MQLTNMNIRKMRLALLANASFMPFDRNKLSHKVLCALSSVALIGSATAAQKGVLNVTTGGGNTIYPLDSAISNDPTNPHSHPDKELWVTSNIPIVSTANHTYAGATVIGQKVDSSGNAEQTAATFYNMGQIGSTGKSFTVNPNGVLRGSGTVVGNVSNTGIVSPGNNGVTSFVGEPSLPIGTTMHVTGDYTHESPGRTWLYFSPTAGDKVAITGAFNPSTGTLYITPTPGYYSSAGTVTHTAISWAPGASEYAWGYGTGNALPSGIVITTAAAGADYLELNVTAHQTSTGLAFTFAGVDQILTSGAPVDLSTLESVTGSINAGNGTVIASTAGTPEAPVTTAIATKLEIAAGGSANIQAAANSTVEFSGEIAGGNLNLSSAASGSTVKFEGDSPDYEGTVAATGVKATFNGDMSKTSIAAGAGSTIGGSGSIGAVTVNGATLKPGNSVGTSTYASLNATGTTHYQVEMNSTAANKIIVTGNANLGTDFIVDILMDSDVAAYTSATHQIITAGGTLTGNVNTLTWTPQAGLVFDIDLNTSTKVISLISTIASPISIGADQTTAGTTKRRIITSSSETATSLIGNYNYITLINGTISNAGDRSITTPINVVGSSSISTSSGTTTLGTANTLAGASTTTLNITGAGTTAITAANPNFLGTLAVGSGSTLSLGSSASFDSAPTPSAAITLTAGTLQLANGMTLIYPISSTGISAINTTGTTTLGSALSNASSTTLKLTGGTTTINRTNSGLSGTLNVENSTLYLGSSAVLGSGTLSLTSSAILNNSSSGLTNPISASSSTINLDAEKNLGSGALSLTNSTLNFSSGGAGTTTLTNSGISIAGASTLHNNVGSVYLGSGALTGAGTLNFTSGNATYITYVTASNSGFSGAVNISSKVNIGNGSNLGSGTLTPQVGGGITP